jgi:hypothetical protein
VNFAYGLRRAKDFMSKGEAFLYRKFDEKSLVNNARLGRVPPSGVEAVGK